MLPECLTIRFEIGEEQSNITISNPFTSEFLPVEIIVAEGRLVEAIGRAGRQIRSAAQSCGSFTRVPYSLVIKPVSKELETEFQKFRKVMESNEFKDLYLMRGKPNFVRHWMYMSERVSENSDFRRIDFCSFGGECWFGPKDYEIR